MTLHIGIDPGLSGAIAILEWIDGGAFQTLIQTALEGRRGAATVERVSAMPRQGIASAFTFGVGFGSVLSVLQAMHVSLRLVTPAAWKRYQCLGKDKAASLHRARLLYPSADLALAKHDGRAEALLIADYGRRNFSSPKENT